MNRKSLLLLVVLLVILGGCNNSFENPKEQAAPTSVPTLTPTPEPTSTPTPSPTNTPTPTPEPTNTPTPKTTNTPTPSPTNTPTPSPTPITGSKYLENDKVVICTKDKDDFWSFYAKGREEIHSLYPYVEVLAERTLEDYSGIFDEYHAGTIRFDSAATVEVLKECYDMLLYNAREKIGSIYPIFVEKERIAVNDYLKNHEFQSIIENKEEISISAWANIVAMEDGEPFFCL